MQAGANVEECSGGCNCERGSRGHWHRICCCRSGKLNPWHCAGSKMTPRGPIPNISKVLFAILLCQCLVNVINLVDWEGVVNQVIRIFSGCKLEVCEISECQHHLHGALCTSSSSSSSPRSPSTDYGSRLYQNYALHNRTFEMHKNSYKSIQMLYSFSGSSFGIPLHTYV
jgi:hypothetical protein